MKGWPGLRKLYDFYLCILPWGDKHRIMTRALLEDSSVAPTVGCYSGVPSESASTLVVTTRLSIMGAMRQISAFVEAVRRFKTLHVTERGGVSIYPAELRD